MNGWGTTPMTLVGDNEWRVEIESGAEPAEFKFDVYGDGRLNFGENDYDFIADQGGRNIALPGQKRLVIHFNDESHWYWIEERTYSAEVLVVPPEGIEQQSLRLQRVGIVVNNEPYGWSYVYLEEGRATPVAPLSGLPLDGHVRVSFDSLVSGVRLVGEVAFTVDGTSDPIVVTLPLKQSNLEGRGILRVHTVADRWDHDHMVSSPYGNIGIFLGDWQAQQLLGHTDADGYVEVMVPVGRQKLSAMTMTSSHSHTSASVVVDVAEGATTEVTIHLAPTSVQIRAYYSTGWGNALYLTGASDYLGNWQKAIRLEYDSRFNAWTFDGNLPLWLPFKVVMAPWSDAREISTLNVRWEQGPNHVVTPPSGYYMSVIDVYPVF